jgi:uncharacterized protein YndB with AHSA1/START domain
MAHAEETVTVDRPIAEVFAFLADGLNEPKWRPEVSDVRLASTSATGVGAAWAQSMKGPGGRKIEGDYRITQWQEPTRLDFEVIAGPARPLGSFVLRELETSSTSVTFTLDLTPKGLMVFMTRMINRQVASEAANILNLPAAMAV